MAGAARGAGRQAARLGLLALASACAAALEPPGGPPDFDAPVLLAVLPDSTVPHPRFRGAVVFRFDEVVSERSAPNLADLFLVSPRHERIDVAWKRQRLEVRPQGGWRDGTVYQIRLLPGVTDLRNNRLRTGHELVFSTGPEIPVTTLTGTVVNWPAARLGIRALVEAIAHAGTPDSLVYVTQADSAGEYALRALPPGPYLVVATVDENNNRRRDRREAFDSATMQLDSTRSDTLWAFVHDTIGPQLRTATATDSVTVRLEFSQALRPGPPDPGAILAALLPDSTPVALDTVLLPAAFDSLRAAEARARDSLAALTPDSAAADTAAADTAPRRLPAPRPGARDLGPIEVRGQAPDTGRVAELLRLRPPLVSALVVRLADPLIPGGRYLFSAQVANPNGARAESRVVLVVPDTTGAPRP